MCRHGKPTAAWTVTIIRESHGHDKSSVTCFRCVVCWYCKNLGIHGLVFLKVSDIYRLPQTQMFVKLFKHLVVVQFEIDIGTCWHGCYNFLS